MFDQEDVIKDNQKKNQGDKNLDDIPGFISGFLWVYKGLNNTYKNLS